MKFLFKIIDKGFENYYNTFNSILIHINKYNINTIDEIWIIEHFPIITLGLNSNIKNILIINKIPIIYSDRGGEVTYHGPGQILIYFFINLNRIYIIKNLIKNIEKSIIDTLLKYNIKGKRKKNLPGVYIKNKFNNKFINYKIASLGLRIKKNCIYHGISLNVCMDLKPFNFIKPCGYNNIKMVNMQDFNKNLSIKIVKKTLINNIIKNLYNINV